jgi:hypothetical protein
VDRGIARHAMPGGVLRRLLRRVGRSPLPGRGPKFLVESKELDELVEANVDFWEGDDEDAEADEEEDEAAAAAREQHEAESRKRFEADRERERAERLQKLQQLEQLLEGREIVVTQPLPATLRDDARRHFPVAGFSVGPTEKQLWAYVRHQLSNFETLREELWGKGLSKELYWLFRQRTDRVVRKAVAEWERRNGQGAGPLVQQGLQVAVRASDGTDHPPGDEAAFPRS